MNKMKINHPYELFLKTISDAIEILGLINAGVSWQMSCFFGFIGAACWTICQ